MAKIKLKVRNFTNKSTIFFEEDGILSSHTDIDFSGRHFQNYEEFEKYIAEKLEENEHFKNVTQDQINEVASLIYSMQEKRID